MRWIIFVLGRVGQVKRMGLMGPMGLMGLANISLIFRMGLVQVQPADTPQRRHTRTPLLAALVS